MIINGISNDALEEMDAVAKALKKKGAEKDLEALVKKSDFVVLDKKGTPVLDAEKLQSQYTRELHPYLKTFTKLLEGTIDEMGGNDAKEEEYDPASDAASEKYINALNKGLTLGVLIQQLESACKARKAAATRMKDDKAKAKAQEAPKPPPDDEWLDLIAGVEQDFAAYERQLTRINKWLKARKPDLKQQKAPQKESPEQKQKREALNALAEAVEKVPKRVEAVGTGLADIGKHRDVLLKLLREGRRRFDPNKWSPLPDPADALDKLGTQLKQAEDRFATVKKHFK
jgi:hypothetical protein